MTQKEMPCRTVGITVSPMPRVAPIRTACSPSAILMTATRESADTSGRCTAGLFVKTAGDGIPTEPDDDADYGEKPDVEAGADPTGGPQAGLVILPDGDGHAHGSRRLYPERQHENEGVHVNGVLVGGECIGAEPAGEHGAGREGHSLLFPWRAPAGCRHVEVCSMMMVVAGERCTDAVVLAARAAPGRRR